MSSAEIPVGIIIYDDNVGTAAALEKFAVFNLESRESFKKSDWFHGSGVYGWFVEANNCIAASLMRYEKNPPKKTQKTQTGDNCTLKTPLFFRWRCLIWIGWFFKWWSGSPNSDLMPPDIIVATHRILEATAKPFSTAPVLTDPVSAVNIWYQGFRKSTLARSMLSCSLSPSLALPLSLSFSLFFLFFFFSFSFSLSLVFLFPRRKQTAIWNSAGLNRPTLCSSGIKNAERTPCRH